MAWDGIPLVYMGDELGLLNDWTYVDDPIHGTDSRWLHRPVMDWLVAERRHRPDTVAGRVFADLVHLIATRRSTPQLHAAAPLDIIESGDPGVLAFARRHWAGDLTALYNFSETHRTVDRGVAGLRTSGDLVDLLADRSLPVRESIDIPPLGVRWLVASTTRP